MGWARFTPPFFSCRPHFSPKIASCYGTDPAIVQSFSDGQLWIGAYNPGLMKTHLLLLSLKLSRRSFTSCSGPAVRACEPAARSWRERRNEPAGESARRQLEYHRSYGAGRVAVLRLLLRQVQPCNQCDPPCRVP